MAVNPSQLAIQLANGIGQTFTTAQVEAFASGILDELTQNGSATFGDIAGPHPISGLSGASMANQIAPAAGYPGISDTLQNFCQAIADHITDNGVVTYTGPAPNPPAIPPSEAWFLGGTISGLNGPGLALEVAAAVGYPGTSAELIGFCSAITDHIEANAEVTSGVIS
jgi:hypothetical protein